MAANPQRKQKQLVKKKAKRKAVVAAKKMLDKLGGMLSQTLFEKAPRSSVNHTQLPRQLSFAQIWNYVNRRPVRSAAPYDWEKPQTVPVSHLHGFMIQTRIRGFTCVIRPLYPKKPTGPYAPFAVLHIELQAR